MNNSNQPDLAGPVYAPDGNAINGYDPVAFFTNSSPVKGTDTFAFQWQGANWNFASQQDLEAFKAAPETYAPQYGGYCAYGMAEGHKATTVPEAWTIVDGKLYLNNSLDVKAKWDKDRPGFIKKADAVWNTMKNGE